MLVEAVFAIRTEGLVLVLLERLLKVAVYGVNERTSRNKGKNGPTGNPGHAVLVCLHDPIFLFCALFPKARRWSDKLGRRATHGTFLGVSRIEDATGFVCWVAPLLDALNDR